MEVEVGVEVGAEVHLARWGGVSGRNSMERRRSTTGVVHTLKNVLSCIFKMYYFSLCV